jgi:hypothetical protein
LGSASFHGRVNGGSSRDTARRSCGKPGKTQQSTPIGIHLGNPGFICSGPHRPTRASFRKRATP